MRVIQEAYDGYRIKEFGDQGYCSFTLLATPWIYGPATKPIIKRGSKNACDSRANSFIVQLRPAQHALDIDIAHAASATYESLAPKIRVIDLSLPDGLCAYEMERLRGRPFSALQPRHQTLNRDTCRKLERLVISFAGVIAGGCARSSKAVMTPRNARADSPMDDDVGFLSQCTGKVGSSILQRLEKLAADLPDTWLRAKAKTVLGAIQRIHNFPVVFNHGDLIPSNILVDENKWDVTGLVDWAEAEYLPFGTCLYGLEHLLGYLDPTMSGDTPAAPMFKFYNNASHLRRLFWTHLIKLIPELQHRREDVMMMRDLGVLLWHGIAWDDGAIDRVVNEVDDAVEVARLRAFLGVE